MISKETTLTTGQIATCWNDFEKIITQKLNKETKDFFNIPVSVIVKRKSNNQPVDQLLIENIAMNKEGSEIWLECIVNDIQMVEKEPKVKKHLDESEKKFEKLADDLDKKIENNGKIQ